MTSLDAATIAAHMLAVVAEGPSAQDGGRRLAAVLRLAVVFKVPVEAVINELENVPRAEPSSLRHLSKLDQPARSASQELSYALAADLAQQMRDAISWDDLERRLQSLDACLRPRGGGLVVAGHDGTWSKKASALGSDLAFGRLLVRLGPPPAHLEPTGHYPGKGAVARS